MTGISYMMIDELDLALNEFVMIKDKKHILARPALYYYSHINYLKEDYDTALEGFRQLENDPNFNKVIPMYVSQIYYKKGQYDDVIDYIVPIINDVEESYKPELSKIIGDSYFHMRRYSDALQFLEYYHETPGRNRARTTTSWGSPCIMAENMTKQSPSWKGPPREPT